LAAASAPSVFGELNPLSNPVSYPRRRVVVTRYAEAVDWLAPFGADVIVYNKGPSLVVNAEAFGKVVASPNVGREIHASLSYIIDEWDRLPDFTVFCQADALAALTKVGQADPGISREEFFALFDGAALTPRVALWQVHWRLEAYNGHQLEEPPVGSSDLGSFWRAHIPETPLPPEHSGCYPVYFCSAMVVPRAGQGAGLRVG
jgi:hypothetical protein